MDLFGVVMCCAVRAGHDYYSSRYAAPPRESFVDAIQWLYTSMQLRTLVLSRTRSRRKQTFVSPLPLPDRDSTISPYAVVVRTRITHALGVCKYVSMYACTQYPPSQTRIPLLPAVEIIHRYAAHNVMHLYLFGPFTDPSRTYGTPSTLLLQNPTMVCPRRRVGDGSGERDRGW